MRFRNGATLLLLAVLAYGCKQSEAEEQATAEAAPELAVAEQRTLDIRAEAAGLVEPITTIEIKSKASGEVTNVLVESGQEVRRGTLLVEIEPRDVRNASAQAEADLEVATARAQTARAQYNRVQELRKANVATEQELESAQLEQANAQAALVKARVNVELANERLKDVTIRAPLDGMIIEKTVEPGVIISSASGSVSGGTTLLKMADLSVVQVRALVDQTDIGRVSEGQIVRVNVEAYPNRPFEGTVIKIEPQAVVEQNVTMFPVLVQLANPERLLKPGMNTEVEIEIARRPNAIVIPNDAVVGMRDAVTTGVALGLSEEAITKKLEEMRGSMRGNFAGSGPGAGPGNANANASGNTRGTPSPVETPSSPGAPAQRPSAPAQRPSSPAGGNQQAGGQQGAQMSPECQALMQKFRTAREAGAQPLEEDRTKFRELNCMAGRNTGGAQGQQGQQAQQGGGARPSSGFNRGNFGGGQAGQGGMGGAGTTRRRTSQNRPGYVFVPGANGQPEPRFVMLGYSDFDYTEVISGIKAGEQVYLVTAARLLQQQKEQNDRMRQRMGGGMPGMPGSTPPAGGQRPGGAGPGGGAPRN